jgi:signal transduction histidine kinase
MTDTLQPPDDLAGAPVLQRALQPGVVLLGSSGEACGADERALALLGCSDAAALAGRWADVRQLLAAAGLRLPVNGSAPAAGVEIELPAAAGAPAGVGGTAGTSGRRVHAAPAGGGGALVLQDAALAAALECDLRAASQMRSLAQITPAVAHDLRAPINSMVLNLEVLKETLAAHAIAGPIPVGGRDPRERQQRYLHVLGEELARLHQSLELFLAHIAARGERAESFDLRDAARDLAAMLRPPARKSQLQIEVLVPDAPLPVQAHRFLVRQALLHLGLATLARLPREGTLEIRLHASGATACLRIGAAGQGGTPASLAPLAPVEPLAPVAPLADVAAPAARTPGAPGDGLEAEPTFSAGGTEARLQVARGLLAGGAARLRLAGPRPGLPSGEWPGSPAETAAAPAAASGDGVRGGTAGVAAAPGTVPAFEIDFPLSSFS